MARHTFFSFHYQPDVWRAWNVRNSWVVRPDRQQSVGFFDRSVFEASRRESPDALKRFLREGLEGTSVTCVLAGLETWTRRWVRYEIARSIIKKNGILTVFIDGVKDEEGNIGLRGRDPLSAMGVYNSDGRIYLCEEVNGQWVKYQDYTLEIPRKDLWFDPPTSTAVVKLSQHCLAYDFARQRGRENIDGWIETAAGMAGR